MRNHPQGGNVSVINDVIARVKQMDPDQKEFHQAVTEVMETLEPTTERHPEFVKAGIYTRIVEPERADSFPGAVGGRQGRCAGQQRFPGAVQQRHRPFQGRDPVSPFGESEHHQVPGIRANLQKSLTTLPMGGGKGGSDFDPKGKSDGEIMRFCQAFMLELFRHIGPGNRCAGRRYRRGRSGNRIYVRLLQKIKMSTPAF
jgi:glutamate dehydrogenase (NADP+)